jgi:FkbM family methyltransferase
MGKSANEENTVMGKHRYKGLFQLLKKIKHIFKICRKTFLFAPYISNHYSQDGEDVVLSSFYDEKPNYQGFYVDIGAHHPIRFSNTQLFYEKGWHGINIDAQPGSMTEFNRLRKNDINIETGVSDKSGTMDFFSFEEPALNSFNRMLAEKRINDGWKLKERINIRLLSINDILEKCLPCNQHIDFITMDVEGLEFQIIQSLDFQKYAPDFILIEDLNNTELYTGGDIARFLNDHDYIIAAKTRRTFLFRKR